MKVLFREPITAAKQKEFCARKYCAQTLIFDSFAEECKSPGSRKMDLFVHIRASDIPTPQM
jgi:hypothetical protein